MATIRNRTALFRKMNKVTGMKIKRVNKDSPENFFKKKIQVSIKPELATLLSRDITEADNELLKLEVFDSEI